MSKLIFSITALLAALILALLVWNIYLSNQISKLQKALDEQEFKNRILEGDTDVLTYDLVTCRDSLRIMNERISPD
jgi:uncharacterized protein YoxC